MDRHAVPVTSDCQIVALLFRLLVSCMSNVDEFETMLLSIFNSCESRSRHIVIDLSRGSSEHFRFECLEVTSF